MIAVPVTLESDFVRLEPMTINHLADLCEICFHEEIWKPTGRIIKTEQDIRKYMDEAFADQSAGKAIPFITYDKISGESVGSTRFGNIDTKNLRTEIGWTWITPKWQRSYINTEAKYLMLKHAFEIWNCIRVELKTNVLNHKSRNAMIRIGAKEEGILRNHMINGDGSFRDSIYFSIINSEWPEVKRNFETNLLHKSDQLS